MTKKKGLFYLQLSDAWLRQTLFDTPKWLIDFDSAEVVTLKLSIQQSM